MDRATVIGLGVALAALLATVWLEAGGSLGLFANDGAALIVLGGTAAALFLTFRWEDIREALGAARKVLLFTPQDPEELVGQLVRAAEAARKDGILTLEPIAREARDDFLRQGLLLAIDGTDPESIQSILQSRLDATAARHNRSRFFFEVAGRACPTMGMCGTLIGIIFLLQRMDNPRFIGQGLGLAMVATLYGLVGANLVFLPISEKLANHHKDEAHVRQMVIEGVVAIQTGDNPRIVEEKLRTFLARPETA